jgi:cytoskeletal protein CcmA (bactofilin family)
MRKHDQSVRPPGVRDQSAETAPADRSSTEQLVMDLGTSVIIKGELSGSEDLTLCGQMEGSVLLPDHTLTIGPRADIKAEVVAKAVVILGTITGPVAATERVEIGATGSVTGDITSPRLAIADGAHFCGKVEMNR